MGLTLDTLLPAVLSAFGGGMGVYVAMRVDIARVGLLAKLAHDSAETAHRRIDRINEK